MAEMAKKERLEMILSNMVLSPLAERFNAGDQLPGNRTAMFQAATLTH